MKLTGEDIRLSRDGQGGYSYDRFTVRPVTMGEGTSNGRRWSSGHREWEVTDTQRESLHACGRARRTVVIERLWEVRDRIAHVLNSEAEVSADA